jgi:lipopolysaccharide export system permease protein
MTILFRYIVRELLKIFSMCLIGLMTVYLVVDFFEKLRKFIRYDADMSVVLVYFALRIPAIALQIAPLATLMATLLALGMLARSNEVTAMRSCGISLYRIAAPFVAFALMVALVFFGLTLAVIPLATSEAEFVKTVMIEKKALPPSLKADRSWLLLGNRQLMNIEAVDPDGSTLRGIVLYQLEPEFRLKDITEAKEARYTKDGWILLDGVHRSLLPDGRLVVNMFESQRIVMSQMPEDFNAWVSAESEEMTLRKIRSHVDRLERDGYNFSRLLTDYHGRVAFPFVNVIMAVVGIALSLRQSGVRGGGMGKGIGLALLFGFLYWTTHSLSIALGRSDVLVPLLAGWMANLVFLSFASYLLLRVRQ